MSNLPIDQSIKLRELTSQAVRNGVTTPSELELFILDNGWERELPTRPTIVKLLAEVGIKYVKGCYVKSKGE